MQEPKAHSLCFLITPKPPASSLPLSSHFCFVLVLPDPATLLLLQEWNLAFSHVSSFFLYHCSPLSFLCKHPWTEVEEVEPQNIFFTLQNPKTEPVPPPFLPPFFSVSGYLFNFRPPSFLPHLWMIMLRRVLAEQLVVNGSVDVLCKPSD